MAGNDDSIDPQQVPPLPPVSQQAAKKTLAKSFHCINCGGPVTIRYPGASLSVVCPNCNSIIDANDENYHILTKFFKATRGYKPLIPLGSRGKLKDREWEVIGYMVRSDVQSGYYWDEYLLFNPYYGFRWLTQDRGHWNFVTTIKRKPVQERSAVVSLDGRSFKIYNSGRAQVDYVIGEFYWRVVLHGQVEMQDYIDPPLMLSRERDDNEVVWSQSEFIEPAQIAQAFPDCEKFPFPAGISATRPPREKILADRLRYLCLIFCGFITCSQIYLAGTALNQHVMEFSGTYAPNAKKPDTTTPVFELKKDLANVEIIATAPVSNSWFWIGGELTNNDTGQSFPFENDVEYYFGTDSDGAWSEGSDSSTASINSVPAGKYYINFDMESGGYKPDDNYPRQFQMVVKRDVPEWGTYWWTMFLLWIVPGICWMIARQIEIGRWSNSDFNPYQSSS